MFRATRAFTLIELLTVIAIIAVLAGITFGVIRGVKQRAAVQLSRAELAIMAQALEEYRRQFGAYPNTTDNARLVQSLVGRVGPDGTSINGRSMLVGASLRITADDNPTVEADPLNTSAAVIRDPWDQPYRYVCFVTGLRRDYVLFSMGPDGIASDPTSATALNESEETNLDNIYANR